MASGPLEGFGRLTALTNLDLAKNRFSGEWDRMSGRRLLHQFCGLLLPWLGYACRYGAGLKRGLKACAMAERIGFHQKLSAQPLALHLPFASGGNRAVVFEVLSGWFCS